MPSASNSLVVVGLAVLVVTAGCTTTIGSGASTPSTPEIEYRTVSQTVTPAGPVVNCSGAVTVSLWGLNDRRFWQPDEIRYAAYLPANSSYLFVAYVDGTPHGVVSESNRATDDGVNTDGAVLELDRAFAGTHTVSVVVHRDGDSDGSFDPTVDPVCRNDDGLVRSTTYEVNFSGYDVPERTATP